MNYCSGAGPLAHAGFVTVGNRGGRNRKKTLMEIISDLAVCVLASQWLEAIVDFVAATVLVVNVAFVLPILIWKLLQHPPREDVRTDEW